MTYYVESFPIHWWPIIIGLFLSVLLLIVARWISSKRNVARFKHVPNRYLVAVSTISSFLLFLIALYFVLFRTVSVELTDDVLKIKTIEFLPQTYEINRNDVVDRPQLGSNIDWGFANYFLEGLFSLRHSSAALQIRTTVQINLLDQQGQAVHQVLNVVSLGDPWEFPNRAGVILITRDSDYLIPSKQPDALLRAMMKWQYR